MKNQRFNSCKLTGNSCQVKHTNQLSQWNKFRFLMGLKKVKPNKCSQPDNVHNMKISILLIINKLMAGLSCLDKSVNMW